jgi:hypothetical protein
MPSLNIHHNIHLTREQCYLLNEGTDIVVVGVSVPVWVSNKLTSEPAKEVFCKYYIKNPKQEIPIKIFSDGYEITMPYREGQTLEISDEEWRDLNLNNPEKLQQMYSSLLPEVSAKNLLDVKDMGCEFLSYRELNEVPTDNKTISIMHHVTISRIENLIESLS